MITQYIIHCFNAQPLVAFIMVSGFTIQLVFFLVAYRSEISSLTKLRQIQICIRLCSAVKALACSNTK